MSIVLVSEMYDINDEQISIDPLNVFHPVRGNSSSHQHPQAPIRLSYHDGCHYNAGLSV